MPFAESDLNRSLHYNNFEFKLAAFPEFKLKNNDLKKGRKKEKKKKINTVGVMSCKKCPLPQ